METSAIHRIVWIAAVALAMVLSALSPDVANAQSPSPIASSVRNGAMIQADGAAPVVAGAQTGEYQLAVGDTVEVTVAGMPELTYRTTLSVDGQVIIPIGEPVYAAGLTLNELRDRVRKAIAGLAFQRQTTSGVLPPMTLPEQQIAVQIVEYRPVYLNGDVSEPGAQTFRPGMTVRQALADAGGYNLLPLQARPPILESSELLGRLHEQQLALLLERARVTRLRGEAGLPAESDAQTPAAQEEDEAPFVQIENARATARQVDFTTDVAHLRASLEELEEQRGRMAERQSLEENAANADQSELERLQGLADRRVVPLDRVTEARRALMLSSSRVLDATVELGTLQKESQIMRRELDAVQNERQVDILEQLSDAELRLRQVTASIEATKEQLVLLTGLRPDLREVSNNVTVVIARLADGVETLIDASLDMPLVPGDVVEIDLKRDTLWF